MMDNKEWRDYSVSLEELLDLELNPVAVSRFDEPLLEAFDRKVRVCRAILKAGKGETIQISKENNACFGAAWHMGFRKVDDPRTRGMIEKFVVEGEKLFSSYEALHNLVSQMGDIPDNSDAHFLLCPMENAEFEPELVIFICDPEAACRILTLSVFIDGNIPKIKIGGPTCRMAITYPLVTGELNISFYDYTARKMCGVERDKLLVTVPYQRMPQIVESIDKCSAGTAKVEYPQEFREFLQKTLTAGQKDG
jgi:uncharacterized protein (DUF169 family)